MRGEEIKPAQRAGDPNTSGTDWHLLLLLVGARERMVADNGIADRATLKRYHDAWEHAARRADRT